MQIAFIGLGEAASAIVSGWGQPSAPGILAFDIKSTDPATAAEIADRATDLGVRAFASRDEALSKAEVVFSTVTADQAEAAAAACAPHLREGVLWCDLNSCAPDTKRRASAHIAASGARYLDVAVMAPVHPRRNMVPCLVSGPGADAATELLSALPMNLRAVGDQVGRASAIKLVRSIMVKGLEALTAECALAAERAGVGDEVFPSLKDGWPEIDVPARAAYNLERMVVHGTRRAAEMDEAVAMLADLGIPSGMSEAAVQWQRRLGGSGIKPPKSEPAPNHAWFTERILSALGRDPA